MHPTLVHLANRAARLAALALFAAASVGCQSVAGTSQYTQVRFIDASPDAPGLDIYQNAAATLYNIGFGTVSSYIPNTPGTYTFSAEATRTQQGLASVRGTLGLGGQYTVLVGNVAASLQMTILKDQATPAAAGQVALRFIDQTTRTAAVDIYLLPSGSKLTSTAPFLTNIVFGTVPAYAIAPSGTYSVVVVPAGTVPSGTTSPLYTGNQVGYAGGTARTLVLIDQPLVTMPGLQVITADDYDSPTATS